MKKLSLLAVLLVAIGLTMFPPSPVKADGNEMVVETSYCNQADQGPCVNQGQSAYWSVKYGGGTDAQASAAYAKAHNECMTAHGCTAKF